MDDSEMDFRRIGSLCFLLLRGSSSSGNDIGNILKDALLVGVLLLLGSTDFLDSTFSRRVQQE